MARRIIPIIVLIVTLIGVNGAMACQQPPGNRQQTASIDTTPYGWVSTPKPGKHAYWWKTVSMGDKNNSSYWWTNIPRRGKYNHPYWWTNIFIPLTEGIKTVGLHAQRNHPNSPAGKGIDNTIL